MSKQLMDKHSGFQTPSPWITRWMALAPANSRVLDLACGSGRHGRLFLERGHRVVFLDRHIDALSDLVDRPDATLMQVDLESGAGFALSGQTFGAVVVTCYLHRPILDDIIAAVAPGGVLLYETFARGNEIYGHPARDAYLLEEGELLRAVDGKLSIRAYEHGYEDVPKPGVRQRICAVRPDT